MVWLTGIRRIVEPDYEYWTEASVGFFKKSVEEMYVNRFGYTMYVFLLVVLVLHVVACILLIVSSETVSKTSFDEPPCSYKNLSFFRQTN